MCAVIGTSRDVIGDPLQITGSPGEFVKGAEEKLKKISDPSEFYRSREDIMRKARKLFGKDEAEEIDDGIMMNPKNE